MYITEKPITLEMVTEIKPSEIDNFKQRIAALEARVAALEEARYGTWTKEEWEQFAEFMRKERGWE